MEKRLNLAILQARMSSTRLPNKVLKEVNGIPLLKYECERLLKSQKIDKLIIATSIDKSDDAIESFAKENCIDVFRGSLDDVLSRYYECAKEFKEKVEINKLNIIRVTGDCPIIDPKVIDEVIEYFETNDCDYASNTLVPTYPDGMDIEICTFEALEIAYNEATFKSDREHVTLYIKNNKKFKKINHKAKNDFSHLRLTVDEQSDFDLIKNILENLYPKNKNFTYLDIVSYMSQNPYLFIINSTIKRDEGLDKSLIEDTKSNELIQQTKFNKWNKLKQKLNNKKEIITFYQGNIYFMSIGVNIGHESYGKDELFLRPVLVYKKLTHTTFLGIPLTSKHKTGTYFFNFAYKKNIESTAMLNQMRVYDIRRSEYLSGKVNKNTYKNLEAKVKEFMKVTSSKRRGMPTRAKCENIVSNQNKNVKDSK